MYKRINLDENPTIDRYYHGKRLILEVQNSGISHCTGDIINIDGNYFIIRYSVSYPELDIIDYHISFKQNRGI